MKITILGATGQTGEILVKKALLRGHHVTAFARTPSKLNIQHHLLEKVEGDAMDAKQVRSAIKGADAVISVIAPTPKSPDDLMQAAAENIVNAMKENNVDRLVWSTGAGVRAPEGQPTLMQKSIEALLKLLSPKVLINSERGTERIIESDLRWTIARAPMLINESRNNDYKVSYVGPEMGRSVTRENFAEFMLDAVENDSYIHERPAISD